MPASSFGYSARLQAQTSPERWRDMAGMVFFLGLIAGTLFWWNGGIDPHEAPKQVMFMVSIILAIPMMVAAMQRGTFHRPFAWITSLTLGGVFLSGLVSWSLAPDRWLAFFGTAGSIAGSFLFLLIAITAAVSAGTLAMLGWKPSVAPVYGLLSGTIILTFVQRLGWIDLSSGGGAARLFSPVGNEVALAWLVGVVILFVLAQELFVDTSEGAPRLGQRGFFVLSLLWLGFLDLTPIWIMLLIGSVGMGLIAAVSKTIQVTRGSFAWIVGVFVLSIGGLIFQVPQPSDWPQLVALSGSESWSVVRAGWEQTSMWFGVGQGQWMSVFEKIRPVALNRGSLYGVRFDTGGAYVWTVLLQQGILGAVAWGVFFLFAAIKTIIQLREKMDRLPLAVAVWAGIGALFFMQPHGWGLVLIFAALGYLLSDQHEASRALRVTWSAIVLGLGVGLLVALPYSVQRLRADQLLVKAQLAQTSEARHALTQRARSITPWLADVAFIATQADTNWLAERLQKGIQDAGAFQQDLATAIEVSQQATKRWSTRPELWLARGALYAAISPVTKGADQFAIQAYQEGMKYAPHHPGFPLGMARVFLGRADTLAASSPASSDPRGEALAKSRLEQLRLAAEWFKRALEQKPDDLSVQYAYASTLARSGNLTQAAPLFEGLWKGNLSRMDLGLEYATVLAALERIPEAIVIAEKVGSKDRVYIDSRRLLALWYEKEHRYAEAINALRALPLSEQQTPAFRQRLNRLQSESSSTAATR